MKTLKQEPTIFFAKLSLLTNAVMVIGKLIIGIFTFSFFMCINAFYNIGMGLAKHFFLKGYSFDKTRREQQYYYSYIGIVVLITSIVYMIYSVRLLVGLDKTVVHYPREIALLIAAFTFTEIIVNIRGSIVTLKHKSPLQHAVKLTNLASSLICLVLTQTAILSFTNEGDNSFANGLSGIIFGGCAAIIGVYMIVYMDRVTKGKNYWILSRKIRKLMREKDRNISFAPVHYEETELDQKILHIHVLKGSDDFDDLRIEVKKCLQVELIDASVAA